MNAFVHAWFRSGSTWLWEKFRRDENFVAYCEPLHESLPGLTPEQIKSPHVIPFEDANHPPVDRSYYYEYLPLVENSDLNFDRVISYDRYELQAGDDDIALHQYLTGLIDLAQSENKRAALCFCRSAMRARWMKNTYGGVHIAQIRNPWDQWQSFKKHSYFINRCLLTGLSLEKIAPGTFHSIPGFQEAFRSWVSGGGVRFSAEQCSLLFIHLWIYSAVHSMDASDIIIDVDLLGQSADTQKTVSQMMSDKGLPSDLSDCKSPNTGRNGSAFRKFNEQVTEVVGRLQGTSGQNGHLEGIDRLAGKLEFLIPETAKILTDLHKA
jgi:hypothetical protein